MGLSRNLDGLDDSPDQQQFHNVADVVGADFDISDNVILNLEYMQYLNRSNYDLSAIALGVTFSF